MGHWWREAQTCLHWPPTSSVCGGTHMSNTQHTTTVHACLPLLRPCAMWHNAHEHSSEFIHNDAPRHSSHPRRLGAVFEGRSAWASSSMMASLRATDATTDTRAASTCEKVAESPFRLPTLSNSPLATKGGVVGALTDLVPQHGQCVLLRPHP